MAQRRFHYEAAFEHYLRCNRVPYIAVDEARKALFGGGGSSIEQDDWDGAGSMSRKTRPAPAEACSNAGAAGNADGDGTWGALKSFDFVVYAAGRNLLVDIKGRRFGGRKAAGSIAGNVTRDSFEMTKTAGPASPSARNGSGGGSGTGRGGGRFENWVTMEDVTSLQRWERLFGPSFRATFVFIYALCRQPPDTLFEEIFEFRGTWYALREIDLGDYARTMVNRSSRWGTVQVPQDQARRMVRPFAAHRISDPASRSGQGIAHGSCPPCRAALCCA